METQVSNLIRSLAYFIEEESTTRLPDVRRKIRRLQRTLELISAILPDAERRRMLEETIKLWSKELKEVIYDAEDLIDRYTLELPQFPEQQAPVRRYQFRLFNCFTSVASHGVGIGIEEINNRLKKIAKDGAIYQLRPSDVVSEEIVSHPRKSPIVPKVGIEEEARALARLLLNPLKPGNQVLAITGMGGIGKTTLAEKIYNAPEIKQHFHMRIWVLVSQHFKEADLLRGIISSAAYSAEVGATRQELQQILSGVIKGRRILIVLDDVWSADVWENVLQDPLQSGAPGSRVLITTRNEDIAKQMGVVMIHNVRPLGIEDSWFLLRKTASVVDEGEMEWLSHIGMEIVHKCEGVPLALKAIGCVLRDKELSQHEWSKVLEYLKINRDGFLMPPMPPLYLSYEALPSSAKSCFLYCSLLPENQMIAHRDLMQMWISEGFVQLHSSAGMPEDLAEAYCATIAATNLLELKSNGNETDHSCRIHDVIRDLAISLTKDDNYSGDLSQLGNTRTRVRRLSIGSRETILSPDVITCHTGLRSLLIFDNLLSDNMLRDLVDQLSYLRVLNLQGSAIQEVPSSLGTLFHLRYLNLSGTRIRHLPESIKDLQNLLFLNLHGCMDLDRIPNGITELYNLRSLDILHTNLDDMPSGIRAMRHLNTLVGFVPGNCALEELEYLEQIRYLHVRKLDRVVKGGAHLRNKNNLRSLVLSWEQDASQAFDQYEIEDILNDLGPPASLEQLTIECYSRPDYPGWMSSPSYCPNLVGLNLKSCKFSTSLPSLGQLPKLKNLCISASKGIVTLGTEFFGNSGLPFPKLESLVIEEMDNWEEWSGPSDRKTLPVFREMHLKKCPKLRSLPHCLRFSTALTKLVVEAADSIRMIEDLHFVTELSIKDCPNLERISYLTALKTLEIVRCPLLQDLGDAEVLQHLILEDFTLESLPRWLAANKLMNLRMLEITGNHDLLKSLQMVGPERHKIATVPYVYVYSTGNSRSIASLPVAKRNQSASLQTSLPLKSVEIHEIATEESKSNTSPPNATEERNQSASLPTSLPLKSVEIHEIATEESKSNTSPPNATEEKRKKDIQQILIEAKSRWLRPSEICEILRNHQRFSLAPEPPYQPRGGSLFLFDRKALRYFRKDGHSWRKRKDGKTVREAHEKLKSGSVDVLHCYYAHGEDNENFQRRSYWMLDGQLEHIVLVHYRDITEGCRSSTSHLSNTDPEITGNAQGDQSRSTVYSTHLTSAFTDRAANESYHSTAPTPSSEFEDADSGDDFGGASITDSMSCSRFEIASLHGNDMVESKVEGCSSYFSCPDTSRLTDTVSMDRSFNPFFANLVPSQNLILSGDQQNICGSSQLSGSFGALRFTQPITPATWQEDLCLNRTSTECQEQNISSEQPRRTVDSLPDDHEVLNRGLDDGSTILVDTYPQSFRKDGNAQFRMKEEYYKDGQSPFSENGTEHNSSGSHVVLNKTRFYTTPELRYNTGALKKVSSRSQLLECTAEFPYAVKSEMQSDAHIPELGELKKLDSFGRWMDKEIGKDCDDSLMTSDSGSCWNSLNTPNVDKEVSCLSRQMQLGSDSLGPSLSGEQLFSILDFSPDWAYSGIGTKVLITGTFLGGIEPNTIKWCCMFGEQEVSAEVLTKNVIRCEAPIHPPGRVPFYITCSNRLACSEVREFEYREKQSVETYPSSRKIEPEEEIQLQVRFAKMLSLRADTKKLICTVENCPKCLLKKSFFSLLTDDAHVWDNIEKDSKAFRGYHINHRNILLEKMLKYMLYHWLAHKVHEEDKGPHTFDEEGQGAIHLAAALGYQWAMNPIVSAGVHPSFRDAHGRTALHWAAYFGREETVVALIRLGASPGAVEDPTSTFPGGKTAADLASSRGHKGIAGYLAEAALNSHLSALTIRDSMLGSASATADEVVEIVKEQNGFSLDGEKGDQLSLRGPLAAVRNATLAAAQIQFAFRSYSFRQRQLRDGICGNNDIDNTAMALSSLSNKAHTTNHFSNSLHVSAAKIQQKYRGWKGHRDFVKIRDRIVKIQAHVRGHQVRKQYKKVIWSVSIVEKAILRWRRKRSGLRGFGSQKSGASEQEVGENDEYEFFRLGQEQKVSDVEKALGRVRSMVRSPAARDQYMRLVAIFDKPQLAEKEEESKT